MNFAYAWALLLLPLALLPFFRSGQPQLVYSWSALIPRDPLSTAMGAMLRVLGAVAIAALVLGIAQPYLSQVEVERVGRGAEIVLLLDRSRSMDQAFRGVGDNQAWINTNFETKRKVAVRLLSEFTAGRAQDVFGMMVFSTVAMPVLDFTRKQEVIQAAILAGDKGRGLGDTEVGSALESALGLFAERPYQGSRVIMLVSDGGAHIDFETRKRITREMKRQKVALYWIYLRSFRSPGLNAVISAEVAESVPEHFLHNFFQEMGTTYRAFEAENPEAMKSAIAEIDRLENLPIRFTEVLARQGLSQWCYALALASAVLLSGLVALQLKEWR